MRHKWQAKTTDGQTEFEPCACGMKRVCGPSGPLYFTWNWLPTKAGQCFGPVKAEPEYNTVPSGARAE